ncbi:hypothetical protein MRX96_055673 [Rhipicephalus microplus]
MAKWLKSVRSWPFLRVPWLFSPEYVAQLNVVSNLTGLSFVFVSPHHVVANILNQDTLVAFAELLPSAETQEVVQSLAEPIVDVFITLGSADVTAFVGRAAVPLALNWIGALCAPQHAHSVRRLLTWVISTLAQQAAADDLPGQDAA